jgi:hypothetical protein
MTSQYVPAGRPVCKVDENDLKNKILYLTKIQLCQMQECGLSLKQIKRLTLYCKTPSWQSLNKKKKQTQRPLNWCQDQR